MKVTIKIPPTGESISDLFVVGILCAVGAGVSRGDALILLEAEKTNVEVPSPVAGIVEEIRVAIDQQVNVGDAICVVRVT